MQIIARNDLASINEAIVDGQVHELGVVKIFAQHPEVAQFIPPSSNLAVSWVRLEGGQVLPVHKHPEPSLILICEGSGRTMGSRDRDVAAGDIVLVPSDTWHGFEGTHDGFWALSIQFNGQALYENADEPNVVFTPAEPSPADQLLEDNKKYLEEFRNSNLLRLIDEPSLADHDVRERLLDCLQTWSDVFQDLLHLRVALTTDPEHKHIALDHLVEELGHNNNLRNQRQSAAQPGHGPDVSVDHGLVQGTDALPKRYGANPSDACCAGRQRRNLAPGSGTRVPGHATLPRARRGRRRPRDNGIGSARSSIANRDRRIEGSTRRRVEDDHPIVRQDRFHRIGRKCDT